MVALVNTLRLNAHLRHLDLSRTPGAEAIKGSFETNAPRVAVAFVGPRKRW